MRHMASALGQVKLQILQILAACDWHHAKQPTLNGSARITGSNEAFLDGHKKGLGH